MKKIIVLLLLIISMEVYSQPIVSFSLTNPRVSGNYFLYDLKATVAAGQKWRVASSNIRVDFTTTAPNVLSVSPDNPVINANINISNAGNYQPMTTTSVNGGTSIGLNILILSSNFYTFNSGTYTLGTLRWNIIGAPFTNASMLFRVPPSTFPSVVYDSLSQLTYSTGFSIQNPITTDIASLENQIPTEYNLFQNYPNPFNPTTKIYYSIISPGDVKIIVYDSNGKEIAILVNEQKAIGNYSVEFNSDKYKLASGIYFYKIQAGEFVDTKKMVLIK